MEYEELAPNFRRALLKKVKTNQPYWQLLGIKLVDVKRGWARLELAFSEKLVHPYGVVHGGAIFSLADSAVGMAMLGLVKREQMLTTVEMKINYIRPFREGKITAEAEVLNKGKNIAVAEADIHNNDGNLVAKCIATYMIMKGSKQMMR